MYSSQNAIPLLRILAPSTLEKIRQIFTMKMQVYSGIREYLNTPINNFLLYWVLGVLDCQPAIE